MLDGAHLEHYAYSTGRVEPLAMHAHDEYQLAFSFDATGKYFYRHAEWDVPVRSFTIIHPGELHTPNQRTKIEEPSSYWMMYLDPARVQSLCEELAARTASPPFFSPRPFFDDDLARAYVTLFDNRPAARLEQDVGLLEFTECLVTRHAQTPTNPVGTLSTRREVLRARDFLLDNLAENVSLADLAQVANLSQHHLNRTFRRELGVPPQTYQTQMRVARARLLLAAGESPSQTAAAVGFYDQSHLNRHFKRIVGVTAGGYAQQIPESARSSYTNQARFSRL